MPPVNTENIAFKPAQFDNEIQRLSIIETILPLPKSFSYGKPSTNFIE